MSSERLHTLATCELADVSGGRHCTRADYRHIESRADQFQAWGEDLGMLAGATGGAVGGGVGGAVAGGILGHMAGGTLGEMYGARKGRHEVNCIETPR